MSKNNNNGNKEEKGTILVVEDSSDIRQLMELTIKFGGYKVEVAHNGEEALKKIKKEQPALVITDLLMPKVDGFSLIYKLRSNPETRDLPVMVISATYVAPEDKDLAMSLGATSFMQKPVDIQELLLTVGEIIFNPPAVSKTIISEKTFYEGYRKRLEAKLRQKSQQLDRNERLLQTLPEDQKAAFQKLLDDVKVDRDFLISELNEIIENLKKIEG